MSDASKIIGRLEARYKCPQECDGTVAMTLGSIDGGDQVFLYQCDTCGCAWNQDGSPLYRIEGEA